MKRKLKKEDAIGFVFGISLAWATGFGGFIPYIVGVILGVWVTGKMLNSERQYVKIVFWILFVTVFLLGSLFHGMRLNFNYLHPDNETMQQVEGLEVAVLQDGSGDEIQNGSVAVVHYTGTLDDGTVFDSSLNRGTPFEFTLGAGQVIPGWDLGVLGMKVGEKRRLVIAPELAYGPTARGSIPANSILTFEVELLEIR